MTGTLWRGSECRTAESVSVGNGAAQDEDTIRFAEEHEQKDIDATTEKEALVEITVSEEDGELAAVMLIKVSGLKSSLRPTPVFSHGICDHD